MALYYCLLDGKMAVNRVKSKIWADDARKSRVGTREHDALMLGHWFDLKIPLKLIRTGEQRGARVYRDVLNSVDWPTLEWWEHSNLDTPATGLRPGLWVDQIERNRNSDTVQMWERERRNWVASLELKGFPAESKKVIYLRDTPALNMIGRDDDSVRRKAGHKTERILRFHIILRPPGTADESIRGAPQNTHYVKAKQKLKMEVDAFGVPRVREHAWVEGHSGHGDAGQGRRLASAVRQNGRTV